MMRTSRCAAVLTLLWVAWGTVAHAAGGGVPDYISTAIADPSRPPEQRARDGARRPAAVLTFAGVRPGDRVADFMSGGAYFTRLFSRIVGGQGRVYAFLPTEQLEHCAPEEVAGTRALEHDAAFGNVSVLSGPVGLFRPPEPLDLVWTSLNFHDLYDSFMGPADVPQVVNALYAALKPGGILLVVDHAAAAGSEVRDTETLHRIDPEVIVRSARAAGFLLESRSDLLRNPADTHTLRVFDAAVRGRTDQVILKFLKPLHAPPAACDARCEPSPRARSRLQASAAERRLHILAG
jgi:predicted methyltransferase